MASIYWLREGIQRMRATPFDLDSHRVRRGRSGEARGLQVMPSTPPIVIHPRPGTMPSLSYLLRTENRATSSVRVGAAP